MSEQAANSSIIHLDFKVKIVFWLGVLVMVFAVYDLGEIGGKSPYGMHQWRQCDAYSMALNYAMEPRGLFQPAMHFQHGTGGGEAVGEFPLSYFVNGKLWKAIGVQPWTLRWTHLTLLLLGCWCLFRSLHQFLSLKSAMAVTWFTMSSGLIAFYGPNYMVNAAGLGLVYAGWWEAFKWWRTECTERMPQLLMVLAFSMAMLFRPTMALGLIPPAMAVFGTKHWIRWTMALGVPVVIGVVWVVWTKWLNGQNESVYFLTTLRPLWEAESLEITWRAFCEDVLPNWYHKYVLLLAAVVLVVSAVRAVSKPDRNNRWIAASAGAVGLASVVYIAFWFENLNVHDYYLVELQVGIPIAAAWVVTSWKTTSQRVKRIAWVLFVATMSLQLADAGLRTRMKHRLTGGWLYEQLVPSRERAIWEWFHWDQERRYGNVAEWTDILRSLGIERNDLVLSVTDPSPNISLSLMDQKGFTNLYDDGFQGEERLAFYFGKGASYLMCNDPDWYEAHKESRWLSEQITHAGNFRVFDLMQSDANLEPQKQVIKQ
ncbi:MAG: hypothetical protein CL828_06850 [Crocinitomicaceae bacterium]|nr:hypothetical protein [Crocinitomicaceae bacterium]